MFMIKSRGTMAAFSGSDDGSDLGVRIHDVVREDGHVARAASAVTHRRVGSLGGQPAPLHNLTIAMREGPIVSCTSVDQERWRIRGCKNLCGAEANGWADAERDSVARGGLRRRCRLDGEPRHDAMAERPKPVTGCRPKGAEDAAANGSLRGVTLGVARRDVVDLHVRVVIARCPKPDSGGRHRGAEDAAPGGSLRGATLLTARKGVINLHARVVHDGGEHCAAGPRVVPAAAAAATTSATVGTAMGRRRRKRAVLLPVLHAAGRGALRRLAVVSYVAAGGVHRLGVPPVAASTLSSLTPMISTSRKCRSRRHRVAKHGGDQERRFR